MHRTFDIANFRNSRPETGQYERQLKRSAQSGKSVDCIEQAVRGVLQNLSGPERKSFVVYGEPQSGKTEMMICLTAKLLDDGRDFILHLLNDSVDLLDQNLGRFQESGLAPSAQNFTDILDPAVQVKTGRHVIFCKKNGNDLAKLLSKIGQVKKITVIDDEADYASPNSRVNNADRTPVNDLITKVLGSTGDYIGVTATPARLDLNNTFNNVTQRWVNFPPHSAYTGQDVFFPLMPAGFTKSSLKYQLNFLPHNYDDPKHARQALFSFFVNIAYLNTHLNVEEVNYSMLVHTSGKTVDHKSDWTVMKSTLSKLSQRTAADYADYVHDIWKLANKRYPDVDPDVLTSFVVDNITRNAVIILNSDKDFKHHGNSATKPSSLFTIVIGGNIVSRGVTFENLLSMFFTRDVKHKIQQDTYIQRARMFGSRAKYLRFFELTIPEQLYADWHRCFVFHRLALEAITKGDGSPVWLGDKRIVAVAGASIDRSTVDIDKGEMSFRIFSMPAKFDDLISAETSNSLKLDKISELLGDASFPPYLKQFITQTVPSLEKSVVVHPSSTIANYKDAPDLDKAQIQRRQGFFGPSQMGNHPGAIHHLKVFYNQEANARLFYKFVGSVQFIKNLKR